MIPLVVAAVLGAAALVDTPSPAPAPPPPPPPPPPGPPGVAALYVSPRGPYAGRLDVDAWTEARDARSYSGPLPVVAHPPCAAWGAYAKPHPGSAARGPLVGDDGGRFAAALRDVRIYGGVIEHPARSRAWAHFGLPVPAAAGGWTRGAESWPGGDVYVCQVEQGHYGHAARKPTWLYLVSRVPPPPLIWGPSQAEVRTGTSARRGLVERMSQGQRARTPDPFAELLLDLARNAPGPTLLPATRRPLGEVLEALRPQLAQAAQAVIDAWEQDEEGWDDIHGGGGVCDDVARALQEVLAYAIDGEILDGGWDGDDHAWTIVHDDVDAFAVDIPPWHYETGGGYAWSKIEGAQIAPEDIVIERLRHRDVMRP